jgi:hypothetical protein
MALTFSVPMLQLHHVDGRGCHAGLVRASKQRSPHVKSVLASFQLSTCTAANTPAGEQLYFTFSHRLRSRLQASLEPSRQPATRSASDMSTSHHIIGALAQSNASQYYLSEATVFVAVLPAAVPQMLWAVRPSTLTPPMQRCGFTAAESPGPCRCEQVSRMVRRRRAARWVSSSKGYSVQRPGIRTCGVQLAGGARRPRCERGPPPRSPCGEASQLSRCNQPHAACTVCTHMQRPLYGLAAA